MDFNHKNLKSKEELEWQEWARNLSREKFENDEAAREKELEIRTNKAIKEGIKKAMIEIALRMINEGKWTDEKISQVTNLPVSEIEKLRKSQ